MKFFGLKGLHRYTITEKDISMVINKLNNRPRKCLGFKTPNQVFFGLKLSVALGT
jgi:IS30 family transposase